MASNHLDQLTDVQRDTLNLTLTCTICPTNLTKKQHEQFHNHLVALRSLIDKKLRYCPLNSKTTSRAYHYKLKEIEFTHKLGFCRTDEDCNSIFPELIKLCEEIENHLRIRKLTTTYQNLRL